MTSLNSTHNRVVWIDIPVADLDRAAAFYRAVLGTEVFKETFGEFTFCVLEHHEGNGGCLVRKPNEIATSNGTLIYLNVNGRIRDALSQVEAHGGKVIEPIHSIGPHGFRTIVLDSEGNRFALHSETDQ
jgi:predicted enzyme related to lactoylglutathione lyase